MIQHYLSTVDWGVAKKHLAKPLQMCSDGPLQVLLTTATSVKHEGKPYKTHMSHCHACFCDVKKCAMEVLKKNKT